MAWFSTFTHHVMWAALWDFMQAFNQKDVGAWEDFVASRRDKPYPAPYVGSQGEGPAKQKELEERYYPAAILEKYRR